MNAIFLLIILGVGALLLVDRAPSIPEEAWLKIKINSPVLEGHGSEKSFKNSISVLMGGNEPIYFEDLILTLERVKRDERIKGLIIELGSLGDIGLAQAQETAQAIEQLKRAGKKIKVWGPEITQAQYLAVSSATSISLDPMGKVDFKGFASQSLYWAGLMEKIGVNVEVNKVGAYKNAPESFTAEKPSENTIRQQKYYLNEAWQQYQRAVLSFRALPTKSLDSYINQLPDALKKENGHYAKLQKSLGYIDEVSTYQEWSKTFSDKVIDLKDYVWVDNQEEDSDEGTIALVSAQGTISNLPDAEGIQAYALNKQLDKALKDDSVKALVLRIDTRGGEVFASELIRRKLQEFKERNKIVVISMSNVVASGGYWISSVSDVILASPMTMTGSIGVFSIRPELSHSLQQLSVGQGGYATHDLAKNSIFEKSSKQIRNLRQIEVERIYAEFKTHVSEGRKLSLETVEENAQGRVMMGSQAKDAGLIDQFGGLIQALDVAKEKAHLDKNVTVKIFDEEWNSWGLISKIMTNTLLREMNLKIFSHYNFQQSDSLQTIQTLLERDGSSLYCCTAIGS